MGQVWRVEVISLELLTEKSQSVIFFDKHLLECTVAAT